MAEVATPIRPMAVDEFLEMEQASLVKHEYLAGEIFAFSGGTDPHSLISTNIVALLWNAARGGRCRVHGSGMLVQVNDKTLYYPDASVTCDERDYGQLVKHYPCLVVEVLSPGTETTDRREKLANCREMQSLQAQIIIRQDRIQVERHQLGADDLQWHARLIAGSELPVPCPETTIAVSDVYEGVIMPGR